jgi:hypothetical protein
MIDLSSLDTAAQAEEGADLALLHPSTGKPLGPTLRLVGMDSDRYNKARRRIVEKRLAKSRARLDLDAAEMENLSLLADCTLGWAEIVIDGADVPFSREAALELYRRFPGSGSRPTPT